METPVSFWMTKARPSAPRPPKKSGTPPGFVMRNLYELVKPRSTRTFCVRQTAAAWPFAAGVRRSSVPDCDALPMSVSPAVLEKSGYEKES